MFKWGEKLKENVRKQGKNGKRSRSGVERNNTVSNEYV